MNTPKHQALQDALGFRRPRYAHVPIVMNMDGTKMSKRDKHKAVRTRVAEWIRAGKWSAADAAQAAGVDEAAGERWLDKADAELDAEQLTRLAAAVGVQPPEIEVFDFRRSGYLPEAALNFVALLGWSPGEDREKMTTAEMVSLFSLERCGKTSAKFDREKLLSFNTDACAALPAARLHEAFRDYARVSGSPMAGLDERMLSRALDACKGFRTFADVDRKVGPLFRADDALSMDADAVRKALEKGENRGYALLADLLPQLEASEAWPAGDAAAIGDADYRAAAERLDAAVKLHAEQAGLKLNDVAQPLRVALTGGAISPTIGETLALLGRERTVRRIRVCLARRGSA